MFFKKHEHLTINYNIIVSYHNKVHYYNLVLAVKYIYNAYYYELFHDMTRTEIFMNLNLFFWW